MASFDPNFEKKVRDFDIYYHRKLRPILRRLEKTRVTCLLVFVSLLIFIFVLLPLFIYNNNGIFIKLLAIAYIVGLVAGVKFFKSIIMAPIENFRDKCKDVVMPEFIKFFDGWSYCKHNSLTDKHIMNSSIFKSYDNKESDDYIKGTYKGVNITISEEKIIKLRTIYTKMGPREVEDVIFKGIFINYDMNKNFESNTFAIKDEGIFNVFNKQKAFDNVKLEYPQFEKEWEVYTDNQIEARYLLSLSFMERMLMVRDRFHSGRIQFSFFDNILFLAVDARKDMFEAANIFRPTINKKSIYDTFFQILIIMSVVDTLRLNKKLGI